ncbi:hypothetical protein FKM82_028164 [Ascaphus truei]
MCGSDVETRGCNRRTWEITGEVSSSSGETRAGEDGMRECVGETWRREAVTAGPGGSLGRLHPAVGRHGLKRMG